MIPRDKDQWSGLDDVAIDIDRAVWRWIAARRPGVADMDALADLTTACEWLLQQPAAGEARIRERRSRGGRRSMLGVVIVFGLIVVAAAGLIMLMLRVAP